MINSIISVLIQKDLYSFIMYFISFILLLCGFTAILLIITIRNIEKNK